MNPIMLVSITNSACKLATDQLDIALTFLAVLAEKATPAQFIDFITTKHPQFIEVAVGVMQVCAP
jgi:hypothetical protein